MNNFSIDQITKGQTESFSTTITEEKMQLFLLLSGDNSPIHTSESFAKQRGYKSCVVYGMLGASFLSTLAGVYLPGESCLLHSVEVKFAHPVYVGDVLHISGTVQEVNTTFNTITIKASITNQSGQKVTRGIIKAGVYQPENI